MNGLLIIVLAIFIFFMIYGYKKGLIRIVFSLCTMILTMLIVTWAVPYMTDFLQENTSIYKTLEEMCIEKLKSNSVAEENTATQEIDQQETDPISILGVKLPEVLHKQIIQNTSNLLMDKEGAYQYVGSYLAKWILKGIAFWITLILVNVLLRIILGALDFLAKLPVIKGINRLFGAAVGFIEGLLVIWLLMFIITISSTSDFGKQMIVYIEESSMLKYLYDNNGILMFLRYMLG